MVLAVPVPGSSAVIIARLGDHPLGSQHRVAGAGSGPAEQVDQPGVGDQGGEPVATTGGQLGPGGRV